MKRCGRRRLHAKSEMRPHFRLSTGRCRLCRRQRHCPPLWPGPRPPTRPFPASTRTTTITSTTRKSSPPRNPPPLAPGTISGPAFLAAPPPDKPQLRNGKGGTGDPPVSSGHRPDETATRSATPGAHDVAPGFHFSPHFCSPMVSYGFVVIHFGIRDKVCPPRPPAGQQYRKTPLFFVKVPG